MFSTRILQVTLLMCAALAIAAPSPNPATTSCVPCPTKGPCPDICEVIPASNVSQGDPSSLTDALT
ncbi:hypothetical protein NEOLEDRAFT_1129826 [Neolentinus lepideus HHB14362 ss-1]|uniref:Uncharacterized protein n=1 Tax=Neolentinus lepideus HHB14362 ss-1 TaxID=1314782 RepID=A0A165UML5_9AGAM|nr:hypothetical protein NEOLEDRAFT_1129826 [Neolentinus lepideus HHB14362 ss-1]